MHDNKHALHLPDSSVMILVVDDESRNRRILTTVLTSAGYECCEADSGEAAYAMIHSHKPDLILLDVMMPNIDGYQVAATLKSNPDAKHIPIIMVTALNDQDARVRGLVSGVEEFVSKPINTKEIRMRVRNLLRLKKANDLIKRHKHILEIEIAARTNQLHDSFIEAIETLICAADYRDDDTGAHVRRISYYSKLLAEKLGMHREFCKSIFYASPLHDIGKIGIPDRILLKQGGLTPEEWKIMKTHTIIGATMLANKESPYLKIGCAVAQSHHERWDGGGYPHGLAGEAIPLAARIMQICDVYDALRSDRPYKISFSHEKTVEIISKGDGRTDPSHFDPQILSAFIESNAMFNEIFEV